MSHEPLRPLGSLLIRAASLPFEVLEGWGEAVDGVSPTKATVAERVHRWASSSEVQEALGLSSPSLIQALERVRAGRPDRGLDGSLMRYAIRMSARATPYGTFASVSVGEVGARTQLRLAPFEQSMRLVQVDAELIAQLERRWGGLPEVQERMRWWPTPHAIVLGGNLRCVAVPLGAERHKNEMVEIPWSPHLAGVLEESRRGHTLAELTEALGRWLPRASVGARQRYLQRLIELGVLWSEMTPATTGQPLLGQLEERAARVPELAPQRQALGEVADLLRSLNEPARSWPLERYGEVAERLRAAPLSVEAGDEPMLHVDLWRPLEARTLGPEVMKEMTSVVTMLVSLPPMRSDPLEDFIQRFSSRYEERWVPLLEALDEDHGVGFVKASFQDTIPLLDGLPLGTRKDSPSRQLSPVQQRLLKRLVETVGQGGQELVLEASDLTFSESESRPALYPTLLTGLAASEGGAEGGEFWLLQPQLQAINGMSILGRFARLHPDVARLVEDYASAQDERHPGELVVDLVDLPMGRPLNIVQREVARSYELVVQGRGSAPVTLGIDELLVGIVAGRVALFAPRLGRQIRVRVTHALDHEHKYTLPVRHFLGEVELQDARDWQGVGWGALGSLLPFLPRVRHGRSILLPARWTLNQEELRSLERAPDRHEVIKRLRQERAWPRWVSVSDRDQKLAIDLDNPLAVEVLVEEMRGETSVSLEEFLPALFPRALRGEGGSFVHELVVPFVSTKVPVPRDTQAPGGGTTGEAAVTPGHSPLYALVHGGPRRLESWLLDRLPELVQRHGIEDWFFVRYADEQGPHLRLRLFGEPGTLWGPVQSDLMTTVNEAVAQGQLTGLALETYRREVDRYGGSRGVELAERLFCADSAAVVEILQGLESAEQRWLAAALAVDALLEDFGLDREAKLAFAEDTAQGFFKEFGASLELKQALGHQFRRQREELDRALGGDEPWEQVRQALLARRQRWHHTIAELKQAERAGHLSRPVSQMMWSYVHMSCNRFFDRSARAQELALHSLLERHYRSQVMRQRKGNASVP